MDTHLSQSEIETFHTDGFVSPRCVFSEQEASGYRARLEKIESSVAPDRVATVRSGLQITHQWAWDLVHDPRIVDPISDVLGPDILLWSIDWFIKEPGPGFVSYHQDATYWGLEPHHVVTAWIALSDAGPATGPMKFIPGSHLGALFEQDDTFEEDNMLSRGQAVKTDVDESKAVLAPLSAGEMSIHHVRVIHGSEPNTTDDRRIGMVFRYCATDVRQTKVDDDRAVLVKGTDAFGHFAPVPRPQEDMGEKERALRRAHGRTRQRALHSMDYE